MTRYRASSRRRTVSPAVTVLILIAIALYVAWTYLGPNATAGSGTPGSAVPDVSVPNSSEPGLTAAESLTALGGLPVKGKSPMTGYDREGSFGAAWSDVDDNGCDTRNDILQRDLDVFETRDDACTVVTGVLTSPYTGEEIDFVRGIDTSAEVQIDHVVALANAWQTGAVALSASERRELANDPLNLFAVDGTSNSQKGAGDAATWLPKSKAFRCVYIEHQVAVKVKYELWVTKAEKATMSRILEAC